MPRPLLPVIVFAQFAGTSLWFAGNAVLAGREGFTPAALTASVQLGFIGGTLVFAFLTLADRIAASRLFLISALLGAVANSLIPAFMHHPQTVLGLRMLTGFFLAGIYPVGMKIAADLYPKGLGNAMGWLVGALVLGTAFPHLLKGSLNTQPPELLFWFISLLSLTGGVLLWRAVPSMPGKTRQTPFQWNALHSIWQNKSFRQAAFGYLGHMWELYTFWAFVPLLIASGGNGPTGGQPAVGLLSFLVIATGAIGCIAGGMISVHRGSRYVSIRALLVSGACCVLLPIALHLPFWLYILFLFIWGCSVVADSPQLTTLAAQTAPAALKGTALTALTCLGFALTIFSLLIIQYLAAQLTQPAWALVVLAFGPAFGIRALRTTKAA